MDFILVKIALVVVFLTVLAAICYFSVKAYKTSGKKLYKKLAFFSAELFQGIIVGGIFVPIIDLILGDDWFERPIILALLFLLIIVLALMFGRKIDRYIESVFEKNK